MEDNRKIRYYLLITANPLSNSKAAMMVFKIIRQLDLVSRDVTIFMPGFHTNKDNKADSVEITQRKKVEIQEAGRKINEDFHGENAVFHTYCENAGDMYFNDADFARFMMDLEERCPNFEYYGRTEMLIIPTCQGEILPEYVKGYNLEPFLEQDSIPLDEFLMTVIHLLRKDPNKESLRLINKIDGLYNDRIAFSPLQVAGKTDISLQIDNLILEYMKWKKDDEIFFISYSTKDSFYAESLKMLLEKHNKHVWKAPEGIPSSTDYACAIPAAMRISSRFLVILSHNSAHSPWVRREIGKAISNGIRLDGIFLDDFSFDDLQHYDHLSFLFENIQVHYNIAELFDNSLMLNKLLR